MIRSSRDAERAARDWMVYFGYRDVRICHVGPDGGVDVDAAEALAQVKAGNTPTGRPIVQQIYGIADEAGKKPIVFTVPGVTDEAKEWADQAGVAIFQLDLAGHARALNDPAQGILARAEGALSEWQAVAAELECRLANGEEASITAEFTAPDGMRGFWGIWIDREGSIRVTRDVAGTSYETVATVQEAVELAEALMERLGAPFSESRAVMTVSGLPRPFEPRLSYPETQVQADPPVPGS